MSEQLNHAPVRTYLEALQARICEALTAFEPTARFCDDPWQRNEGGGGRTRVLRGGEVFEQAGVGFSHVFGGALPAAATAARPELSGRSFEAMGVSVVVHPRNPYVPTSHANVRLIVASKADAPPVWWFGGGFDLTPFYPFDQDVLSWHQTAHALCAPFGAQVYPKYKRWCDEYFHLRHRGEARGVGGLFFDDLHEGGFDRCFAFQRAVGDGYLDAYLPIIQRNQNRAYGERERHFQKYRRGRYVEFNLVWDRGTLFGLQSGGRTESILMSLPPEVRFEYDYQPDPQSPEAKLKDYLQPRDWLDEFAGL